MLCFSVLSRNFSIRLLNVYVSEAETLTRLTDSVLTHQGKNPHFYSVVVKGEEVKVLPTEQVPEAERFPKVRGNCLNSLTTLYSPLSISESAWLLLRINITTMG